MRGASRAWSSFGVCYCTRHRGGGAFAASVSWGREWPLICCELKACTQARLFTMSRDPEPVNGQECATVGTGSTDRSVPRSEPVDGQECATVGN